MIQVSSLERFCLTLCIGVSGIITAGENPVAAQVVRGLVVDSIATTPLSNVTVELLGDDSTIVSTTVTDDVGLFLLSAPQPGEYRLWVKSEGYRESLFPTFQLSDGEMLTYALLLPPADGPTYDEIIAQVCGPSNRRDEEITLLGFVRDEDVGLPVNKAEITFLGLAGALAAPESALVFTVPTDSMGFYAVCDVPVGPRLTVFAIQDTALSNFVDVQFSTDSVQRLGMTHELHGDFWREDFVLSTAESHSGVLNGRVLRRDTGAPLTGVEIRIVGTRIEGASSEDGLFSLGGVPHGRFELAIRHPGFAPVRRWVTALGDEHQVSIGQIWLQPLPATLDPLVVEAQSSGARRALPYFWERRERGHGSFMTRDEWSRQGNPKTPVDVLRRMQGIRIQYNSGYSRGEGPKWIISTSRARSRTIQGRGGTCSPLVYVDRNYLGTANNVDVETLIPLATLEAVEAYATGAGLPIEFNRTGASCGVLIFWTR